MYDACSFWTLFIASLLIKSFNSSDVLNVIKLKFSVLINLLTIFCEVKDLDKEEI